MKTFSLTHKRKHTDTLGLYLQRQQCVAVVVGAEHVVVAPGLRAERSSGAWELGRGDDTPAAERLLHGRDLAERDGHGHADAAPSMVPAPGHARRVPTAAPQRLFHQGLRRERERERRVTLIR